MQQAGKLLKPLRDITEKVGAKWVPLVRQLANRRYGRLPIGATLRFAVCHLGENPISAGFGGAILGV